MCQLSLVESLKEKRVTQVHAYNGCEHTFCVTEEGELYAFGYNYRGQLGLGTTTAVASPTLVHGFGPAFRRRVVHVSCSYYHSVVADDRGELFAFGRNDFGQLGLGDATDRLDPTLVQHPYVRQGKNGEADKVGVVAVTCGQYHTVVAFSDGSVCSCGKNDYGQLGLELPEPHLTLSGVRKFGGTALGSDYPAEDLHIIDVRSGYYHTLALAKSGRLWSFGRNDYGQLGLGHATQKIFGASQVEDLDGHGIRVARIATGCYHSVAVDETGTVYVFGRNNHGQLGCGDLTERHSPWPIKRFTSTRVGMVAAGFYHTIVLTGGAQPAAEKSGKAKSSGVPQKELSYEYILQCERHAGKAFDSALEIMAHIDRLGAAYEGKIQEDNKAHGVLYLPLMPRSGRADELPSKVAYCVDASPQTFNCLLEVLDLCKSALVHLQATVQAETHSDLECDTFFWEYLMLATLRLIKLNMCQLLLSGSGPGIYQAACMTKQRDKKPGGKGEELSRVMSKVHESLLRAIEFSNSMNPKSAGKIQEASAQVLISGLELFYPTQEQQVQLLASLMAERESQSQGKSKEQDVLKHRPSSARRWSPRSPLLKFQGDSSSSLSPSPTLRKLLLEPLLRRLADDELVSAIVPYWTSAMQGNERMKPMTPYARGIVLSASNPNASADDAEASIALLYSLLTSVVRQVASQSALRFRAFLEGKDPSSMPSPVKSNGFLRLLMSLQKHLLSWAASRPSHTAAVPAQASNDYVREIIRRFVAAEEASGEALHIQIPSGNDEEATVFPWRKRVGVACGWDCLLRYSENVIKQAIQELGSCLRPLAEAEAEANHNGSSVTFEEASQVLKETCLSAKLLPSLIVGLSLFAQKTFFAVRLLPRVAELLKVLNEVLSRVPSVAEADEEYCRDFEEQVNRPKRAHASQTNKHALPWLLELFKSVASLSGRLSATLILGREDEQEASTADGNDPDSDNDMYDFWKESDLFQGGLDPDMLPTRFYASGSVIEDGFFDKMDLGDDSSRNNADAHPYPSATTPVSPQKLQKQLSAASISSVDLGGSTESHSTLNSTTVTSSGRPMDRLDLLRRDYLLQFLESTVASTGAGKLLVERLREEHAGRNVQYKMALLQGRGNGGVDASAMERVECAALAALLKHTNDDGVLFDAINFAKSLSAISTETQAEPRHPPVRLMECWRAAAEVRMNLLRLRTHLSGDASGAFTTLCESHRMRAQFLLLLDPSMPFPAVDPLRSRKSSRSGKLWRKLAMYILVCSRWKRATQRGSECAARLQQPASVALKPSIELVLRFIQNPANREDPDARLGPSSPKKGSSPTKRKQQLLQQRNAAFSLGRLFQKMAFAWRQAHLRALGLTSFRSLLDIPSLSSPRVDILRFLAPALSAATAQTKRQVAAGEEAGPLARHYASGLDSVGKGMMRLVHDRFMALYKDLALSLREAVDGDSEICAQERLLLFDSWALTLTPADLHLLSETGLLVTLQRSLALAVEDEEGGKGSSDKAAAKKQKSFARSGNLKKHRQQQVAKAAWTLFRLLLTQVGEGVDEAQVASLLDVLYDESSAVLEKLESRVKISSDSSGNSPKIHAPLEASQHRQTLVDTPYQMRNMEEGLRFDSTDVLQAGEGDSFTLSLWVKLEQDCTGWKRVLALRHNDSGILPIIVVREDDRRVEVWQQGKSDSLVQDHLVSKSQLRLHKWTHVVVVYEDQRLALFIDGAHEAEDDMPEADCAAVGRMTVSLGKPKGVNLSGLKVRGSIEGKLAQVNLHSRALSPIHIRIMFDQGPPEEAPVDDQRCFQLVVLQQGLTNSALGRRCLVRKSWLRLQARMLNAGTLRVQQAVLRLWRVLLPTLPLSDTAPALLHVLSQGRPDLGFVDFMLERVGAGLWCSGPSAGDESGAGGLASEVIMLLRLLMSKARDWQEAIAKSMELAIRDLAAEKGTDICRSLGALAVLGGHTERVRVGGRVAMTHTDITATVVALDVDADANSSYGMSALVVMSGDEEGVEAARQSQEGLGATGAFKLLAVQKAMKRHGRSSRAVRINVDELVPIPEFPAPLVSGKEGMEQLEEAFYELLATLLEKSRGFASESSDEDATSVDRVLLEQTLSSTLQVLHGVLDCYRKDPGRFFARMTPRAGQWGVLQRLVSMAATISPSNDFLTLDGLRLRSVQLRERLYKLRSEGRVSQSASPSEEKRKEDVVEFCGNSEDAAEETAQMEVLSEGEQLKFLFAEEDAASGSVHVSDDSAVPQVLVEELASMGFAHEWCVAALRVCGGDFVAASTWIVDHLDLLRTTPIEQLVAESSSTMVARMTSDSYDYAEDLDDDGEGSEENDAGTEVGSRPKPIMVEKRKGKEEEHQEEVDRARSRCKSKIELQMPCAQLETCLGEQVFNENYFANDSAASYSYGYSCGALSLYNGTHAEKRDSGLPTSREVCGLTTAVLLKRCVETERHLSVVLSRACLLTLMLRWRQWPADAISGHADLGTSDLLIESLCRVLKLLLFRGPQIMPSVDVSILVRGEPMLDPFFSYEMPHLARIRPALSGSIADQLSRRPALGQGFADTLPVSLGSSLRENEKSESAAAAMGAGGSVLRLMLDCIGPAMAQMLREEAAEGRSKISRRLLEMGLREAEAAACSTEHVDTMWGMRDLSMSDRGAMEAPSVEWAMWALGLLLLEGAAPLFSATVFARLCVVLGSANLPLKALSMQLLCGILSRWMEPGREAKDDNLLNERAKAVAALPLERLEAFGQEMYEKEIGSGRGIASKFTAALAELIHLLQRWNTTTTTSPEEAKKSPLPPVVHHGKRCSRCGESPIRGTCYVCLSCEDMALCELCEPDASMSLHPLDHPMIKLKQPLGDVDLPDIDLGEPSAPGVHEGVACSVCGEEEFRGVRFACISSGKDLCSRCEFAHSTEHVMVQMNVPFPAFAADKIAIDVGVQPAVDGIESIELWTTQVDASSISVAFTVSPGIPCESTVHVIHEASGVSVDHGIGTAHWHRLENLSSSSTYTVYVSSVPLDPEGLISAGPDPEMPPPKVESNRVSSRTEDAIPFRLDGEKSGADIFVSADGLTASYTAVETWSTILGSSGFVCGRNSWEVVIEASATSYLFIGVAEMSANLGTFLGGDDKGWGYIGDQAIYHSRTKLRAYGDRFKEKDRIGVTLDMDAGTLSFSKNGSDLGVAIEGLTGKLYPAFAFYNCGQQISLLPDQFCCEGKHTVLPFDPAESKLAAVVREKLDLLGSISSGRSFSTWSIDRGYEAYCAWLSKSKAYCKSKLGVVVELDCSREAFASLAIDGPAVRRDSRVKTRRGLGKALGVLDGRLWVQHDDETDAWFVRTEDALSLVDSDRNDANSDEVDSETARQQDLYSMSKKDFVKAVSCEAWTMPEDEAIVSQASAVGALKSRSAFSLDPADVVERVLPAAQQQAQMKFSRGIGRKRSSDEESRLRNPLASLARFVMLRLLNMDLQIVLPVACGAIGGATQGVGNGIENAIAESASVGQKVRHCRGLILECLKKNVLDLVLARTMTAAKRGEDEYEYPEELPQLTLNRAKAAFSRVDVDAETRLSQSLFGQAFDDLHFLEPRILRMAYSHPMDEGQSRAFRVKFEGEGVDDYGGPYREVFTQWASELTATTLSEDGSADKPTPDFADALHSKGYISGIGSSNKPAESDGGNAEEDSGGAQEGVKCVLPLFHPCPNRQHGVGANRDQVVLKPSSSVAAGSGAHLLMEMYNFVGQLAGIALRTRTHLNLDLAQLVWKPLVAEELDMDDLRETDHSFVTLMEKILSAGPEELQVYCEELRWTSTLSDGTEVELIPGGALTPVQLEHLADYVKIVVHKRLKESERALRALRDGLTSVVPHVVLPLFTGKELKRLLAGAPIISIQLLQQCTEYEDDLSSEDPHIQSFWRVLEAFTPIHRSRFLRFVWARSSLPATAAEFPQKFKIQSAIGEGPRESPDEWLPKAHTCFFSLSLPRYSSDAVMREKLLYAIHNCLEMDADFRLTEAEMTGWD